MGEHHLVNQGNLHSDSLPSKHSHQMSLEQQMAQPVHKTARSPLELVQQPSNQLLQAMLLLSLLLAFKLLLDLDSTASAARMAVPAMPLDRAAAHKAVHPSLVALLPALVLPEADLELFKALELCLAACSRPVSHKAVLHLVLVPGLPLVVLDLSKP
jgi:hypothetical protein